MLRELGPRGAGDRILLEVRAPPRAQVAILGPGLPAFHPVGREGALLVRPARVAAFGFADGRGRFRAAIGLPRDLGEEGMDLSCQAAVARHFEGPLLLLSARLRVGRRR